MQLPEEVYQALRRRAFIEGTSLSAVMRGILEEAVGTRAGGTARLSLDDFSFVASGTRDDRELTPVSERHDEALAADDW